MWCFLFNIMNTWITLIITYKYLIILPLAILEGPFLSLLLGYLIHAGYLSLPLSFILLLMGDILPDLFYYRIGKYGNEKILTSKYFANSDKTKVSLQRLEHLWHTHTVKTMFFGKLSYGISVPIIISAGMAKLPLKRFVLTSLPVGIFQVGGLLTVGYILGRSYALAVTYIEYGGIAIGALLLLIVAIYYILIQYSIKKITDSK